MKIYMWIVSDLHTSVKQISSLAYETTATHELLLVVRAQHVWCAVYSDKLMCFYWLSHVYLFP